MTRILCILGILLAGTCLADETMLSKARNLHFDNLEYRDVSIRDILADLQKRSLELDADSAGVNFLILLAEDDLNRTLTMSLNKPSLERVLNLIATTAGLIVQYDARVIRIEKSQRAIMKVQ